MYTRHCLGPGFGCARTVLTPCLADAVMKGVKVQEKLHVSSCTARVVLVKWDLSCSELQGIQKQASLTLFLLPL